MKPYQLPEHVLVMGLGSHGGGLGVARWLLQQGVTVTITDVATAETLATPLAALHQTVEELDAALRIRYVLGEHRAEDFTNHSMVVVNPAVRPDSLWLQLASRAGASIETEMTLFFRVCPAPIIGITGTKGKTTTALLTGAILRRQYADTVIAGNMRVSALAALPHITPTTPVVLELSSFQLMRLGAANLSPHYAAITNLTPDHLNYHGSMAEYIAAKQQIYRHQTRQGVVVLNYADVQAGIWGEQIPGTMYLFTADAYVGTQARSERLTAASLAAWVDEHGSIVLFGEQLIHCSDILIPGQHNVENVLAAIILAYAVGCSREHITAAIREFRGVDHRLEWVRVVDDVTYINDTTATNPAAAQAALTSFDAPIILIAGGADKGLATGALAQTIVEQAKALVLLAGSATPRLHAEVCAVLDNQPITLRHEHIHGPFEDFASAIATAQDLAAPGDIVLLSPGCASFGMFRDEFHRGEEFRRIVQSLISSNTA